MVAAFFLNVKWNAGCLVVMPSSTFYTHHPSLLFVLIIACWGRRDTVSSCMGGWGGELRCAGKWQKKSERGLNKWRRMKSRRMPVRRRRAKRGCTGRGGGGDASSWGGCRVQFKKRQAHTTTRWLAQLQCCWERNGEGGCLHGNAPTVQNKNHLVGKTFHSVQWAERGRVGDEAGGGVRALAVVSWRRRLLTLISLIITHNHNEFPRIITDEGRRSGRHAPWFLTGQYHVPPELHLLLLFSGEKRDKRHRHSLSCVLMEMLCRDQ